MPPPKISENEFIETIREIGPYKAAKRFGTSWTNVNQRRQRLERKLGITIAGPNGRKKERIPAPEVSGEIPLQVTKGTVIVASDCHYWPGEVTLMHKALVALCKEFKPVALILNGDVMDFPAISRHGAIMWEKRPRVIEEIEFAQERLHELATALPRGAHKIWTFGNHDQRFESRIANLAPEYAKVHGVHLRDHFALWEPCWSVLINPRTHDETQVKHRFRGGQHAVTNNLLWSGGHTVTGHLHNGQVRPLTLRNERTIWGVDTGCLAEPYAASFSYLENSPRNWRSSFAVLTYLDGRLLQPELVLKWDDKHIQFRGEIFAP